MFRLPSKHFFSSYPYQNLNMNPVNEHIDQLIINFLDGKLTPEECSQLQQWIEVSDEHLQYFEQRSEVLFSAVDKAVLQQYDSQKAFSRFQERVKNAQKRTYSLQWFKYAAIFIAVAGLSFSTYKLGMNTIASQLADIKMEAPIGSQSNMYLPDGTIIKLNAGSTLTYSQSFGVDNRCVKLSGEGYFEVAKNTRLPFVVETGSLKVRVLGTKFNITNYGSDPEAVVALAAGKVALDNSRAETLYLSPGQSATFNKKTQTINITDSDIESIDDWTEGILTLDGKPLQDILETLERHYNVKFAVKNSHLHQYCFYGSFSLSEQSIAEVLSTLSKTGKLKYNIRGKHITLYE